MGKLMGQIMATLKDPICLDAHPFATELDSCDSPEAVVNVFRTQAQTFDKFCKGNEKLLTWLDPIVHVLFTFSATLGEGIGLVSHPIPIYSVEPFSDIQSFSHSHLEKLSLPGSVFFWR